MVTLIIDSCCDFVKTSEWTPRGGLNYMQTLRSHCMSMSSCQFLTILDMAWSPPPFDLGSVEKYDSKSIWLVVYCQYRKTLQEVKTTKQNISVSSIL